MTMNQAEFRRLMVRAALLPLLLLVAVASVLLLQIRQMYYASRWVSHTNEVIAEAQGLQKLVLQMDSDVRGYLITGDPLFLEPLEAAPTTVQPALDHLAVLVSDNPDQLERLAGIRTAYQQLLQVFQRKVRERQTEGDYVAVVSSLQGKQLIDEILTRFSALVLVEEGLRDDRVARTDRALWWAVAGVVGLTFLAGGALALFTRRQLIALSDAYEGVLTATREEGDARRAAEQEQVRLRERLIRIQSERLDELSTPLIPLSRDIVLLPLIGSMDSDRASRVLATLSDGVAEHGAHIAILDVTGVSTVDTHVASVLLQAAQVVHLLGSEVILTGIGPVVARTLVDLEVDLRHLTTCRTLEAGLQHAQNRLRKRALGQDHDPHATHDEAEATASTAAGA